LRQIFIVRGCWKILSVNSKKPWYDVNVLSIERLKSPKMMMRFPEYQTPPMRGWIYVCIRHSLNKYNPERVKFT